MKKVLIFFITSLSMLLATMIKLPDAEKILGNTIFDTEIEDSVVQYKNSKIDSLINMLELDEDDAAVVK